MSRSVALRWNWIGSKKLFTDHYRELPGAGQWASMSIAALFHLYQRKVNTGTSSQMA
jgi:hypothetical protein